MRAPDTLPRKIMNIITILCIPELIPGLPALNAFI